jgi:hypothetical protein
VKYTFSVVDSALLTFNQCRKLERDSLLKLFRQIASAPDLEADVDGLIVGGRECMVKCACGWVITYWLDFPIREVRIVALDFAP